MPEQETQQLIEKLQVLEKRLLLFEAHDHFMIGGAPLRLKNLTNYGLQQVTAFLPDTEAGANARYDSFFTAEFDLEVISGQVSYRTNAGAAATVNVYKLTTGQTRAQAITAGTKVFDSTFDLNTTAQTPVRQLATTTKINRILKQGDRLALVDTGTVSSCNHLIVTVHYLPL